jgi:hypothetical protein
MRGVARVQGEVCSTLLFDSDSGASPIKGDADERRSHDASRGAVAEASDPDLGGTAAVRRSAGAPLLTVISLATHLMLGAGAFPALDRLPATGAGGWLARWPDNDIGEIVRIATVVYNDPSRLDGQR